MNPTVVCGPGHGRLASFRKPPLLSPKSILADIAPLHCTGLHWTALHDQCSIQCISGFGLILPDRISEDADVIDATPLPQYALHAFDSTYPAVNPRLAAQDGNKFSAFKPLDEGETPFSASFSRTKPCLFFFGSETSDLLVT